MKKKCSAQNESLPCIAVKRGLGVAQHDELKIIDQVQDVYLAEYLLTGFYLPIKVTISTYLSRATTSNS